MALKDLLPGDPTHLGGYVLAGRLREGGQGVVYEGYDDGGTRVAVKVLHMDTADDPHLRGRFAKEVTAATRVASFCTARVVAADLGHTPPYIVSEFVPGPSLRQAVTDGGPFGGDVLHRLAIAVATALTAVHEAGVVHRDLKPDNVLLGPDGPRVIDFGIARTPEMSLTSTAKVIGTPTYMAPEVLTGLRAGPPADVFAWGGVVLFAASGRDPFQADSLGGVMHRILTVDPDLSEVPEPLRSLVAAALDKDPGARPSARDLLLRLVGAVGDPVEAGTQAAAELGGRAGDPSLSERAEEVYERLSPAERDRVREMFLRLVSEAADGTVRRRPATRTEITGGRPPELGAVVDAYLTAGLLGEEEGVVRVVHPALARAWPRLRTWIGDGRDLFPGRLALEAAARHWDEHGRKETDLHETGRQEMTGSEVLPLNRLEREFLDAGAAVRRRRARRRRTVVCGLAAMLALTLVAIVVAQAQWRAAGEKAAAGTRQAVEAARKAAAQAGSLRFSDPRTARLLSVAAWRLAPDAESRSSLLPALAQPERDVLTDTAAPASAVSALSADGRRFAVVGAGRTRVWDVAARRPIADLSTGDVAAVALSDGGGTLATGTAGESDLLVASSSGGVEVWDAGTGRLAYGRTLLAVTGLGTLREFTVDPERAASELCAAAGGDLSPGQWRRYVGAPPRRPVCGGTGNPPQGAHSSPGG